MTSLLIGAVCALALVIAAALAALVLARSGRARSRHARAARRPHVRSGATHASQSGAGPSGGPAATGTLECLSGPLAGASFDIPPEGLYVGRDESLCEIVIDDDRVSKRHMWVGPRGGRIAAVDQGSTNGTFLNTPSSQRITEVLLNPGDTLVISEYDVARFRFVRV